MKKYMIIIAMLLFCASLYGQQTDDRKDSTATDPTVTTSTDSTVEEELEKQEEQTLDEIMENEDWKDRKPDTSDNDDDDDFHWKKDRDKDWGKNHKGGFFRGGGGGWDWYYLPLNVDVLNTQLAKIGLPAFADQMILSGGGGWGFIGRGIRIGGLGASGTVSSFGIPTGGNGSQIDVTLSLSYGGFLIEKVFHPFNNSEIYLGATLGGGSTSMKFSKSSQNISWNYIWENGYSSADSLVFSDHQSEMSSGFFWAMPNIGFRYNIFRWFAVGADVGYFYQHTDEQKWKMENKVVVGVPKIDFSGVVYRVNFYFGG
ncbi:MAG: hypothetical protein PHW79_11820 [Candidatus Marinimicrobia bacterium]|nr:hypothetical protein [Candidatus Neomarinimicrobiota bacterium]